MEAIGAVAIVAVFIVVNLISFFNVERERERIYRETAADTKFNKTLS